MVGANEFHQQCLVVDAHTDVPIRLLEEPADLSEAVDGRHVDLPKLQQGGVDAVLFALFVPPSLDPEAGLRCAVEQHRLSLEQLRRGGWRAVRQVDEIRSTAAGGLIAVLFGLENGRCLALRGALDTVASMGVRYVTLTHGATHEWCDSATDEPRHGGLSERGSEIVRRLATHGIVADVSHVSELAALQAIEVAGAPVIASHSSAHALCDHPGNLSPRLAEEIARSGGVIMVNSHPAMLDSEAQLADASRWRRIAPELAELDREQLRDPTAYAEGLERLFGRHPLPDVSLDRYVDHIVHLVDTVGEEHVGIGSDFDGIPDTLVDFSDCGCFPALTEALLQRGLERSAVRLILGENFLRVLAHLESRAET